ncbi:MAG: hypothetical protein ACREQI_16970 [Candidatus Binataceae bacterium]
MAPIAALGGAATGIVEPVGFAVDSDGNLYVNDLTNYSISEWYATALAGGGTIDVAPSAQVVGAATELNGPQGLALRYPPTTAQIFANSGAGAVNLYQPMAGNCNSAPIASIADAATGLSYPYGLAYDPNNQDLYAVNYGGGSVTVYSMSDWQAGGNVAPITKISGPRTGIAGALGIAVNSLSGKVYVANSTGGKDFSGSITVYSAGASGDASPVQTIAGSKTNLYSPHGVAIDPVTGNIWVANFGGPPGSGGLGSVTEYAAGADGNEAPILTIAGTVTELSQPSAIALDANSNVYVANHNGGPSATGAITIYTQAAIMAASPNAEGWSAVAPSAEIMAPVGDSNLTLLNDVEGIAVDANGLIYAANFGATGSVTVYPALASLAAQQFYPNVTPIEYLTGAATMLSGPRGIAVDPPPTMTRRARHRHYRR